MSDYALHVGDCLDILPTLPEASVDTVLTDPPYGLNFMSNSVEWDHGVPSAPFWEAALRVAKPGAMLLAFGGTRTHHRLMGAIEDAGWEIRDCLMWLHGGGMPKGLNISKAIDKAAGAERAVVGQGWQYADEGGARERRWEGGTLNRNINITAPATDAARQWHGWGTSLKPAWEPIILAMKPLGGTYAHNALAHGVAGLNIDRCRIGNDPITQHGRSDSANRAMAGRNYAEPAGRAWTGRWPANVLLDEEAAAQLGEPSRFFYVAKPSARERDAGLEEWLARPASSMPGRRNADDMAGFKTDNPVTQRFVTAKKNFHPTVKPVALLQYLCRLTATPTGGVILDPFMGSGSTGIAAILEGRSFMGIDKNPAYVELAAARLAYWEKQVAQAA